MGENVNRFLIDTNILIMYLNGEADLDTRKKIELIIAKSFNLSIISKLEFLGFRGYSDAEFASAKN